MRKVSIALLVLVLAVTMVGTTVAQGPKIQPSSPARPVVPAAPAANPEAVLWDQPTSVVNVNAYVDQDFTDVPAYSSFLADDFTNTASWNLTAIFVPGGGWNGFTTLMNATALVWQIYADNGGVPAGNPVAGGAYWSLSLPPTDPQITISTNPSYALPSDTLLTLSTPVTLPAGNWWFVFYPVMPFSGGGQYGRLPSDTLNGGWGQFINPGGGFGYGSAWQSWAIIGATNQDQAFRLEGVPTPVNSMHLAALNLAKSGSGPYTITATGVVHDQNHLGLVQVKVAGQLTQPDGSKLAFSGKTNAAGQFSIVMANLTLTGKYKFCVKKLTKLGYTYNSAANEVPACANIKLP